jgi:hypothetical protein
MAPPSTIRADATKPCTRCGAIKSLSDFYTTGRKKDGSAKFNSWCKECIRVKAASHHKRTWGPERLKFSAYKRTKSVRSFMAYLLAKARRRNDCSITVEDLEGIWVAQGGKCALTGWEMTMILGKGSIPTNASVDRIDSMGVYALTNVQLVCRAANFAKSDLSQNEFFRLCEAVMEKRNGKIQNTSLAA